MEITRGEILQVVADAAFNDGNYRDKLLNDPKGLLHLQMGGTHIPEYLNVKVVEDTADTVFLVCPYVPQDGDELSDADLEKVAGGKLDEHTENQNTYNCTANAGANGIAMASKMSVSIL